MHWPKNICKKQGNEKAIFERDSRMYGSNDESSEYFY